MKYVKKPFPVECRQLTNDYDTIVNIYEWYTGEDTSTSLIGQKETVEYIQKNNGLNITTEEGPLHASFGDWIIRGIHGEFYPCKPDIFEESYTVADETSDNSLIEFKQKLSDAYVYTFTPEVRNKVSKVLHNIANIFE